MGHQLARAVVAAAVALVLAACGGSAAGGERPPVLDVARDQVVDTGTDSAQSQTAEQPGVGDVTDTALAELPTPDPSSFEGAHRVVNLLADAADTEEIQTGIDVWARRTFTHGPVLLADNIGFGEASGYFASPAGAAVVIVSAGAGPDGEERAALADVGGDEQVTTIFTNGAEPLSATTSSFREQGSDLAPAAPGEGKGLVVVVAVNLGAFDEELLASVGGAEFEIGDGSRSCRTQRIEETGVAAEILGDVERVELEVQAGPTPISLHPWPSAEGCDRPAVLDVTVDVLEGETTIVLVYTADGGSLSTLVPSALS